MERLLSPQGWARCVPFVLFMLLLALRGQWLTDALAGFDTRWLYGVSVLLVSVALAWFWRQYTELHAAPRINWREFLLAGAVGWVVFVLWIKLDHPWMMLNLGDSPAPFKPVDEQGQLIWPLVAVRWLGATLMVPVMEELFWRSFLMRWIDNPDFDKVDPKQVSWRAVLLSTGVFVLAHPQWLAAIVAGLAYALLYRYTGKLWVPVLAHAVTNGALGAWVVLWGAWSFW